MIYRITCGHCDHVYIGSAYDMSKRYKQHLQAAHKGTSKLYRHMRFILKANEIRRRYGEPEHALKCEQIYVTDERQRFEVESLMIHKYQSIICGFNTVRPKIDHTVRMARLNRLLNS